MSYVIIYISALIPHLIDTFKYIKIVLTFFSLLLPEIFTWEYDFFFVKDKVKILNFISINKGNMMYLALFILCIILFSLTLQHSNGAIAWNIDENAKIDADYLLTGCSSIAKSLECAIAICQVLEHQQYESEWRASHLKLITALENPSEIFDLKKDRSKFSMDWYYPILGGINSKQRSASQMTKSKDSFWIRGLGIKCVSDEPWVTVAETSECSIAYKKIGEDKIALELLHNALAIVDAKGIPYMGWQFHENIYWPEETPSWTSAACILAADANNQLTSAANLFIKKQFKS